jgi:hypothetical protein
MAPPPSGSLVPALIFVGVLIVVLARRTYLLIQGVPYSPVRLFAFAGLAFVFYGLFVSTTLFAALNAWGGVAWGLLAPYALVVAAAALLAAPHVRRTVKFERRGDGQIYYRLPWLVPTLYLVFFAARFSLEIVLFGFGSFSTFSPRTGLSTTAVAALVGFDHVYGASLGLLIGRGLGVRRAHEDFARGETAAPIPASDRTAA